MRLSLQNIRAAYGETVVLRDVSLTVPPGAVVALLGPNGAGKTTLLKVASAMLAPISGRVLVDGEDVTSERADHLVAGGICHITEGRSVFDALTVRENLRLFALPGAEEDAIERAINAFPRLGQRLTLPAGRMSGGEQQMLALARAYIREPEVVLLDEVSLGLAPIVVDEIFEFLARLAAGGTSLLIVEQYAAKVLQVADYAYVLSRGFVVFQGEPGELSSGEIFERYLGRAGDALAAAMPSRT